MTISRKTHILAWFPGIPGLGGGRQPKDGDERGALVVDEELVDGALEREHGDRLTKPGCESVGWRWAFEHSSFPDLLGCAQRQPVFAACIAPYLAPQYGIFTYSHPWARRH